MQTKSSFCFDQTFFQQQVQRNYTQTLKQFKEVTRSFALFKIGFISALLLESLFLFFSVAFFPVSALIAILLGTLFLTLFSFFVLLFYFKARKNEELLSVQKRFLLSCRQILPLPKGISEHHLVIAQSVMSLVSYLYDFEYSYYPPPKVFDFLASRLERLSYFFHWEDIFYIKEMLLRAAIEEHLEQIRLTPTDLEVHASLAQVYLSLSKIYREVKKEERYFSKRFEEYVEEKFEDSAQKAIEEFQILNDYSPNDPWVHAELAKGFSALMRKEEEMKEYETILRLSPNDHEVLFRLGVLYFTLGENSKGLRVYEELKKIPYKKAEELLSYYGSCEDFSLLGEDR